VHLPPPPLGSQVLARFHAKCFYLRFASHLVDVCVVPASPPSSGVDHDDVSDDLSLSMHGGGSNNSGNTEPLVVGSKDENPDTGTAASLSSSSWFTQGNVQVPTIRRGVVRKVLFTCAPRNVFVVCMLL